MMDFKKATKEEKLKFILENHHSDKGYWEKNRPECLIEQGGQQVFSDELCDIVQDLELKRASYDIKKLYERIEALDNLIGNISSAKTVYIPKSSDVDVKEISNEPAQIVKAKDGIRRSYYRIGIFLLLLLGGVIAFALLNGCAHGTKSQAPTANIAKVKESGQALRPWLVSCAQGIACKEGDRGDGDSLLWAGLLCLSGEKEQCLAAKASQGSNGRIWRSPSRIDNEVRSSSSRDMLVGFQAYLVGSKDKQGAEKLMAYLEKEKKLCPDQGVELECELTPTNGAVMYEIYRYLGLEPSADMKLARVSLELALATGAAANKTGYQLHLVGAQLLILKKSGLWTQALAGIAAKLVERQPMNPFFRYLSEGSSVAVANRFLELAPKTRPEKLNQWSWERDTMESAWKESMGWDFVFLSNLISG